MIAVALLVLIALPGLPVASLVFRRPLPAIAWLALAGAGGILWSTITTLLLTLLRIPLTPLPLILASLAPCVAVLAVPHLRKAAHTTWKNIRWNARDLLIGGITIGILALPFLLIQKQLPTGDVQKALFWAERIAQDHRLPAYETATDLNRDPIDFFTPALHTLTAGVSALSGDPYRGIAWFSFLSCMILAGLAAALASHVTHHREAPMLAFLFVTLNHRFLRYAFAPGYHYQNLLGEILLATALVALFFLLAALPKKDRYSLWLIGALALALLPLVHQFSAFLAVFLFGGVACALLILRRARLRAFWTSLSRSHQRTIFAAVATAIIVLITAFLSSPFAAKVPHLFTAAPHLTPFIIPPAAYAELLGAALVFLGLAGIIALLFRRADAHREPTILLVVWVLALLLLGQGPRFFVDIPSARTLFYAVVPLAVLAAACVAQGLVSIRAMFPRARAALVPLLLTLSLAPFASLAARQWSATTHDTRVNVSLTEDMEEVLGYLSRQPRTDGDAILIDDWNRRRLTWTILSPFRMLTRVGGDLRVIADESAQSDVRKALYDAHLDYEKIFMLGNSPLIDTLLERQHIQFIGTANGITDDVFRANPALTEALHTENVTLFMRQHAGTPPADGAASFLLSPATLVNDVGDSEDTLPHTAVSLAATRITEPAARGGRTVRTIEALDAGLRVNVGTYILPLWDSDRDGRIDVPLRLLLRATGNGARGTVSVEGTSLERFALSADGAFRDTIIDVPRDTLVIDEKGFITFTIASDAPLLLDLVAVGALQ